MVFGPVGISDRDWRAVKPKKARQFRNWRAIVWTLTQGRTLLLLDYCAGVSTGVSAGVTAGLAASLAFS